MPAKKKETQAQQKQDKGNKQKAEPKAKQKQKAEVKGRKNQLTSAKAEPEGKPEAKLAEINHQEKRDNFPIVGVGASAGGVQALENFFAHMPSDCGMAFVVVQHLDPHHESLMSSLLTKQTHMKVSDVQHGIKVEAEQIYIRPPGVEITIRERALYLRKSKEETGARLPIDTFFRSLAEDQKDKAICVVLSGASNDGTLGAKLIKGEGGLVVVQDEKQAQYGTMPRSVIDAGVADLILPVEAIPQSLMQYAAHPSIVGEAPKTPEQELEQDVHSILMLVRTSTGHDFSQYKRNTILRRIERRMALHQLHRMNDYRRFLRTAPEEVIDLFKDLTINVTSFFRDADAFDHLKRKALVPMLNNKQGGGLRIWVPGCATGEEAYSIAMVLSEAMEELENVDIYTDEIKVFGTDINSEAIQGARSGSFPENIAADVSKERLKRFFRKKGQQYHVNSKIRDMMIFAVHDVTRDPPFSNMDLISCRNLLIYMNNDLQAKLLPIFHYALKPGGNLFLGTSETTGAASDLFTCLDQKNKIYRNKPKQAEAESLFQLRGMYKPPDELDELAKQMILQPERIRHEEARQPRRTEVQEAMERAILEKYAPPAVLIDDQSQILYFQGDTARYLSPPTGVADFDIFKMVQGELHYKLRQALEQVRRTKQSLRAEVTQVRHDDSFFPLELLLTPIAKGRKESEWVLLEFKEPEPPAGPKRKKDGEKDVSTDSRVSELEHRLQVIRQELQATIEELETSNEELKSANEELQANNEELQSTNEELESSKEELQSTNEELETVNAELFKKNQDLIKVEDDLNNLFSSSEVGTLFLDQDLRIKKFTPAVERLLNLQERRDIGREVSDISANFDYTGLEEDAKTVLDTLVRKEIRTQTKEGRFYLIRINPYRSNENIIQGVVITFLDVTDLDKAQLVARDAETFFYQTLSALWEPILILNKGLIVSVANRAFFRTFQVSPKETLNRSVYEIGNRQWDIARLRQFLEEIIPMGKDFEGYEVAHEFPGIGYRKMLVNGRKIEAGEERRAMILLSFRDVTEQ